MDYLTRDDPEIAEIARREETRIENTLDLIAAESLPPRSIMAAQGSMFGVKAAEGYPGNRFHAGCSPSDEMERLAISRGKRLFGADHVNVQPHSGTSANLAIYFSVLEVGDRILAMKLSHGGHLSHGSPVSITGKCFEFAHYGVDPETERIDYDRVRDLAREFNPRLIVAGASSYPRLIDYETMADIAKECSAFLMADMAHIAGLVAGGVIPSPAPHCDFVSFTTYKTLMGGRGGVVVCKKEHAKKIDRAMFPGAQGTPALNQVAAKAVCFQRAMEPEFKTIQEKTLENAACFAREFEKKGYHVVTGGTDTHLTLIDLRPKGLTGDNAEKILEKAGIVLNRNVIPNDARPPGKTSGIRIGSPSITARGMGRDQVVRIAELIDSVLMNQENEEILDKASNEVLALCKTFPAYKN